MPLWITEQDVSNLLDLPAAIEALEIGLREEAAGQAHTMSKTHVAWEGGNTLHAIGAVSQSAELVATKTWAHTLEGATPLLILWNSRTGSLEAVIEAFALGQLRTGGITGVATRYMSRKGADSLALIGAGKQALAQAAAIAAVRPLREIRVFSRAESRREALAQKLADLLPQVTVNAIGSVGAASEGAAIVTLVTRADAAFFSADMAAAGTHINAVGAITPERRELCQDVFGRTHWVAADDVGAARRLSSEFIEWLGHGGDWSRVESLSRVVASGSDRASDCDLSIFKAMGMGISDLALGSEVLRRARSATVGRDIPHPVKAQPKLVSSQTGVCS